MEEVYRTSYEWAKLGGTTIEFPFGQMVYNLDQPDYKENNCFWYFDPASETDDIFGSIQSRYQKLGISCYSWIPSIHTNVARSFCLAHSLTDEPSVALMLTLKHNSFLTQSNINMENAASNPVALKSIYSLNGQRWSGNASQKKALSLLSLEKYESYICYWEGKLVGRVGLLKCEGNTARLKSIFIGQEFRRKGIATGMINFVANRAADLGYEKLASEVEATNEASLTCHIKAGFLQVGTMHCYG